MHHSLFSKDDQALAAEVLAGLTAAKKVLSPRLFYDEHGSTLYEQICRLPEYYPVAAERRIMERRIFELARLVPPNSAIIELGSGSIAKARFLLSRLRSPAAYVPIDISADYLTAQAQELCRLFPCVKILPVAADYTRQFRLPELPLHSKRLVYYPGSSIGNFTPGQARKLAAVIARLASVTGAALIGVDRKKDPSRLELAYNDGAGVTARFNLNILAHLNRRLAAGFDMSGWRHHAFYNEAAGRIEMHLVCTKAQYIDILGQTIFFRPGDDILTEYSYKYHPDEFAELVSDYFSVEHSWTDEAEQFSVFYLAPRTPAHLARATHRGVELDRNITR